MGENGVTVSTIEHLMSALHGMGIDNVLVELDGPEVPILDGSAIMWVDKIHSSEIVNLDAERHFFTLDKTYSWHDEEHGIELTAEPAEDFRVDCEIEFQSALIGRQSVRLDDIFQYENQIARCRTFVFLHEVEFLLAHNLIKGGDLDNALVFVDKPLGDEEKTRLAKLFDKDKESIQVRNGVLNTIEPYFPNEPVRHKLLDFVGDIYLLGMPVKAHFKLRCPGHHANTELAKLMTNNNINN